MHMSLARIRRITLAAFVTLAAALPGQALASTDAAAAEGFIQKLGENAVATLSGEDATLEQREAVVRGLLRENLDLELMGRFVLGPAWRGASEEERAEYLDLFADYVVTSYARRLGGYSGQQFRITNTGGAGRADVMVQTEITQEGAPPIRAGWRVRGYDDGGLKIIDVVVEGISMLQTERSQFDSLIRQGGMAGLLETLRVQLSKFSAKSG